MPGRRMVFRNRQRALSDFLCLALHRLLCSFFFFFQAEDGIRDGHVTGVQTCALPIFGFSFDNERPRHRRWGEAFSLASRLVTNGEYRAFMEEDAYRRPELWLSDGWTLVRSEERRVGKEGGERWGAWHRERRGERRARA